MYIYTKRDHLIMFWISLDDNPKFPTLVFVCPSPWIGSNVEQISFCPALIVQMINYPTKPTSIRPCIGVSGYKMIGVILLDGINIWAALLVTLDLSVQNRLIVPASFQDESTARSKRISQGIKEWLIVIVRWIIGSFDAYWPKTHDTDWNIN